MENKSSESLVEVEKSKVFIQSTVNLSQNEQKRVQYIRNAAVSYVSPPHNKPLDLEILKWFILILIYTIKAHFQILQHQKLLLYLES